jgi:hypothetical protein
MLLVKELDKYIHKNDSLLSVSKQILQLILRAYSANKRVELQFQVCGFDGIIPRSYVILTKKNLVDEVATCLTGTEIIMEFGRTKEAQRQMFALNSTIPDEQVLEQSVRQFMATAIAYENDRAKAKGEKPKTGGGVNIVIVHQNNLVWSFPRFDSKDDPYHIS